MIGQKLLKRAAVNCKFKFFDAGDDDSNEDFARWDDVKPLLHM